MSLTDVFDVYLVLWGFLLCTLSVSVTTFNEPMSHTSGRYSANSEQFVFLGVSNGPLSHLPGPWYTNWTDLVLTYHWLKGRRAPYVHRLHLIYGK